MSSILVVIGRITRNQFKCNYLRNQKLLKFSLHFWNQHQIVSIFKKKKKKKKKDERHSLSISETPNKFLKGLVSEHPSAVIVLSFRKNFLIPWFSKDKSFSFIFPFNQV